MGRWWETYTTRGTILEPSFFPRSNPYQINEYRGRRQCPRWLCYLLSGGGNMKKIFKQACKLRVELASVVHKSNDCMSRAKIGPFAKCNVGQVRMQGCEAGHWTERGGRVRWTLRHRSASSSAPAAPSVRADSSPPPRTTLAVTPTSGISRGANWISSLGNYFKDFPENVAPFANSLEGLAINWGNWGK